MQWHPLLTASPTARADVPTAEQGASPVVAAQREARGAWAGPVLRYGLAVGLVLVAHGVTHAAWNLIGPAVTCVFLSAVIIASLYGGRGPGLVATALATLDLDYTLATPQHSFAVVFDDLMWLVVFLAVALVTSSLQARRRAAEQSLRAAHAELEQRVRERTAELEHSREQFALLVNGVPDQAFFMLDRHGNVTSWNAGAARLLGYDAGEVTGRHVSSLWPQAGGGGTGGASAGQRVAALADSRYEDQGWVVRRDGGRFWASVVLTPVQDEAGRARGYAISLRDVTERRSLERDILEVSEREQQRIGHDLHDGLGQELTGIALLSAAVAEQARGGGAAAAIATDAEQVADLIHDAIRHTRDLARGLCPVDLEDDGLPSALRQLADRVGRLPGVAAEFACDADVFLDAATASHLYRIAQEAINNALRHGKARRLTIQLGVDAAGRLVLRVTDDGVGMPSVPPSDGMGLRLMEYRAKMIRGSLDVRPAPGGGTVVECLVTVPPVVVPDA